MQAEAATLKLGRPSSGRVKMAVLLLSLGLSLHMAARQNGDPATREWAAWDAGAQERIWRVWTERSPLPAELNWETYPEYQPEVYRPLTAALYAAFARVLPAEHAYALLRLLAYWLSLILLYRLAREWYSPAGALLVMLGTGALLAGGGQYLRARDTVHAALMAPAILAVARGRLVMLAPIFALLAANREDAALIPALCGLLWLLDPPRRREWLVMGGVTLATLVLARALMVAWVGLRPYGCPLWQAGVNLEGLRIILTTGNLYHPLAATLAAVGPLLLLAFWPGARRPVFLRACGLVFLLWLATKCVIARPQESTHLVFALQFLAPAAFYGLARLVHRAEAP